MKKELKFLKEDLSKLIHELEKFSEEEKIKRINIKDGDFIESGSIIINSFIPRAENFLKKLSKIIDFLPTEKRTRRKKNV